ncbi:inorganic diphosphatase [Taibaiella soli]|uniref:inorganic diphosphatase n=1 Tax=Taibaiella soli TaxID=1649169 RepID=A0A2W2B5L6_9BACT|nr:inorganic diphosphatase [Taibaiella soli]PZF71277.1 inorganic diphosphatase [Taibaiella soli]
MNVSKINPYDKDLTNVLIETPKCSQNKYAYDPDRDVFCLKKTLPLGMMFPFDFGFIPGTKGEDGDPLDVLVILEGPVYPGCIIPCRLLGVLEARQQEKGEKAIRNDRLVAVADCSVIYRSVTKIKELSESMVAEIERFFIDYNKAEGRVFKPLRWAGIKAAEKIIAKGTVGNNPK